MGKHLLVCSGGGHLKQLYTLADRIGIQPEDQVWVSFDTGLSRSLLADREVVYATYAAPRDALNVVRNAAAARKLLRTRHFDSALSTGASLAVSYLHLAARRGVECHFIETAARAAGPSMTGKIIARDRRIHTYTQYPAWSSDRWQYRGSIFDAYTPGRSVERTAIRTAVVTVGTTESYGFDRLFRQLTPLLAGAEVLWQVGRSDVGPYGIDGKVSVPHQELEAAIATADVVVAHAGTGAALTALEQGRCPVLVPRLSVHSEHVDDHQVQIAGELDRRGLAVACAAEDLTTGVLLGAASRSTVRLSSPPQFELAGSAVRAA